MSVTNEEEDLFSSPLDMFKLISVAIVAGALIGLTGGAFRALLSYCSGRFLDLVHASHEWSFAPGWLIIPMLAGLSVAVSRYMVRFEPSAIGSGVQHVEAVMQGDAKPSRFRALPIKFFGGLLSIGSGMALGREGPTTQIAAVIGSECGKLFHLKKTDQSLLYTAVAGAGLSVAFNAPLAGIIFSIEEIAKKITLKRLMVSFTGVTTAMIVYRNAFGDPMEFSVGDLMPDSSLMLAFYFIFSLLVVVAGVFYSKLVISTLNLADSFKTVAPEYKAMVVGSCIGLIAFLYPDMVGGGDIQTQAILNQAYGLLPLLIMVLVRFFLGPICYSVGTPGGLFAPLLLLGSGLGFIFAYLINALPSALLLPTLDGVSFALVGMAALFTVVVRAPFTGVLLVIEMSGKVGLIIPLLMACVISTLIPSLLKQAPIYDALRNRTT